MCYGICKYELKYSGECGLNSEEIPQDADGNKSLRFPVFLELCPENKEPSLF